MTALRLGVLIPCHNEAAVIERRIANLAAEDWPPGDHRLLVVDDGSDDGTLEVAQRALTAWSVGGVRVQALKNLGRPGKAGAIQAALDECVADVDLVVLTDADVVQSSGSLRALQAAFADEPELGMACATQSFVADLPDDGSVPSEASGAGPAASPWDRWTAAVRRFESRRGRLFSVHGQLMAWRAELSLRPRLDVAADDLDLVLALRRTHASCTVRMVRGARFYETKPPSEAATDDQAVRRARAYVQALETAEAGLGLQAWCYRVLPRLAPRLAVVALLIGFLVSAWLFGTWGLVAYALASTVFAVSRTGRHVARLLTVIERARRAERREALSTRWEMQR